MPTPTRRWSWRRRRTGWRPIWFRPRPSPAACWLRAATHRAPRASCSRRGALHRIPISPPPTPMPGRATARATASTACATSRASRPTITEAPDRGRHQRHRRARLERGAQGAGAAARRPADAARVHVDGPHRRRAEQRRRPRARMARARRQCRPRSRLDRRRRRLRSLERGVARDRRARCLPMARARRGRRRPVRRVAGGQGRSAHCARVRRGGAHGDGADPAAAERKRRPRPSSRPHPVTRSGAGQDLASGARRHACAGRATRTRHRRSRRLRPNGTSSPPKSWNRRTRLSGSARHRRRAKAATRAETCSRRQPSRARASPRSPRFSCPRTRPTIPAPNRPRMISPPIPPRERKREASVIATAQARRPDLSRAAPSSCWAWLAGAMPGLIGADSQRGGRSHGVRRPHPGPAAVRLHGLVPHHLPGLHHRPRQLSRRARRPVARTPAAASSSRSSTTGRRSSPSPSAWASCRASS